MGTTRRQFRNAVLMLISGALTENQDEPESIRAEEMSGLMDELDHAKAVLRDFQDALQLGPDGQSSGLDSNRD